MIPGERGTEGKSLLVVTFMIAIYCSLYNVLPMRCSVIPPLQLTFIVPMTLVMWLLTRWWWTMVGRGVSMRKYIYFPCSTVLEETLPIKYTQYAYTHTHTHTHHVLYLILPWKSLQSLLLCFQLKFFLCQVYRKDFQCTKYICVHVAHFMNRLRQFSSGGWGGRGREEWEGGGWFP